MTLEPSAWRTVGGMVAYNACSISMLLCNKRLVTNGAMHPLRITLVQLVISLGLQVVVQVVRRFVRGAPPVADTMELSHTQWLAALPTSLLFVAKLTVGARLLATVPLALYPVISALTIPMSALCSLLIERRNTVGTWWGVPPLAAVVVGYLVGTQHEIALASWHTLLAVGSCLASTCYTVMVSRILATKCMTQSQLLMANTVWSVIALALAVELLVDARTDEYTGASALPLLLGSGLVGYLTNIATFAVVARTSPLTLEVVGNLKGAVQSALSLAMFGESWQVHNTVGTVLKIVGSLWFTATTVERT